MGTQWIRIAAIAAVAAASFQAHAASVTLTGWAFGNGNTVNVSGYNGAAGAFVGRLSGAGAVDTNNLVTYCIELSEFFSFSQNPIGTYQLVDGATYFESRRNDEGIADRLGRLLTFVAQNPTLVDTAAESTSMQVAVWNMVYDTDWTVTANSAFRDTSSYRLHANTLLTGAQGVLESRFDVFALQRAGSQDFLLATQRPSRGDNPVPEPASLALVALALAGLGATRKRSANRAS